MAPSELVALTAVLGLVLYYVRTQISKPNYPPGPKRWPIVGNFFGLPESNPWVTYFQWKKQYGDVVYLKVFSQNIVILNSKEACVDLLQDRGGIYSDRPHMKMLELMGWDIVGTGFMRYGALWKEHRKLLHHSFRQEVVPTYRPTVETKMKMLLEGLLDSPLEFGMHIRNYPASIILDIVYGHQLSVRNDQFVTSTESTLGLVGGAFFAGAQSVAQLVNLFPILENLPSFTAVQKLAEKCRERLDHMQTAPYDFVKDNMKAGTGTPSAVADWVQTNEAGQNTKAQENVIKAVAATAFAAGTDTTTATMESFILAMMMSPEVVKKAQAEIDRVVGRDRLPNLADRDTGNLPYLEAVFRENFRFRPSNPLGLTHATTQDDVYKGHFIPKGSLVMSNMWAMTHDEDIWDEPYVFKPERFLNHDGTINDNSFITTFGFGRRLCPGRFLAYDSVWLGMAGILAIFNVGKAKDEHGLEIPVTPVYNDSLVSHPAPFGCTLEPRDAKARHLIES